MKNFALLFLFSVIILLAIFKGSTFYTRTSPFNSNSVTYRSVPYIGRIQILNGCGIRGAAYKVSNFLRSNHFDVKNIGNADSWNFPETLIISRTINTDIAKQVAIALSTQNIVLIRNQETRYDVTVIIGNDYMERMQ